MNLSLSLFVLLLSVANVCLADTKENEVESLDDIQQDETKTENLLKKLSSALPTEFSFHLINTEALNESVEISTTQSNLCASLSDVLVVKCGCQSAANVDVVFKNVISLVYIHYIQINNSNSFLPYLNVFIF